MVTRSLTSRKRLSQKAFCGWICPSCSMSRSRRYDSTLAQEPQVSQDPSEADSQKIPRDRSGRNPLKRRPTVPRPSRFTGSEYARDIFSLIQPTGIPHLGNYLGALRRWKELQDERTDTNPRRQRKHKLYFGLADLHALTLKQDAGVREYNIRQTYAALLAMGLDVKNGHCILFIQSLVPEHAELMWILSNVASTGYLSRMTQWKDKLGMATSLLEQGQRETLDDVDPNSSEKLKLGLFSYPVLQAADILLYGADSVPVGEDQAQHVEFTRHLARAFNSTYPTPTREPLLIVPEVMLSPAKRVMSLKDPTKKMSKSDPDTASRILITDSAEEIRKKIKGAKTDSVSGPITYQPAERPGVSNLIEILSHITRSGTPAEIATQYADTSLGAFKDLVSEEIVKELDGVRDRFESLIQPEDTAIEESIVVGTKHARARAGQTMIKVKQAIGLPVWGNIKKYLSADLAR